MIRADHGFFFSLLFLLDILVVYYLSFSYNLTCLCAGPCKAICIASPRVSLKVLEVMARQRQIDYPYLKG